MTGFLYLRIGPIENPCENGNETGFHKRHSFNLCANIGFCRKTISVQLLSHNYFISEVVIKFMTGNLIKIHSELLVRTSSHTCWFIYPVFTIPFRPVCRALITKGTNDVLRKDSCNETPNVFICRDRCHVR